MPINPNKRYALQFQGLEQKCEQETKGLIHEKRYLCKDVIERYMTLMRCTENTVEYMAYYTALTALIDAFNYIGFITDSEVKEYTIIMKNIDKMRGEKNQ